MHILLLLYLQLMISFGLLVMIWLIQILHYPLFEALDQDLFQKSMSFHQARISWIVIPLMMTELLLALGLAWIEPNSFSITTLGLVVLIWLSTFFLQVPLHQKLLTEKNSSQLQALVRSNWLRTILWSLKFLVGLLQLCWHTI